MTIFKKGQLVRIKRMVNSSGRLRSLAGSLCIIIDDCPPDYEPGNSSDDKPYRVCTQNPHQQKIVLFGDELEELKLK